MSRNSPDGAVLDHLAVEGVGLGCAHTHAAIVAHPLIGRPARLPAAHPLSTGPTSERADAHTMRQIRASVAALNAAGPDGVCD